MFEVLCGVVLLAVGYAAGQVQAKVGYSRATEHLGHHLQMLAEAFSDLSAMKAHIKKLGKTLAREP